MIGCLPTTLDVNGVVHEIRTDYRIALMLFEAFNDDSLNEYSKTYLLLDAIYVDFDEMSEEDYDEALDKAKWYLDGGVDRKEEASPQLISWTQDEQMIFSSVNKVANKEVRSLEYLHWWTFLGYFMEINEGLLSNIILIRQKKAKGKKLEKYEKEFYQNNKNIIDIKKKYTKEEQEEIDRLNALL